MDDRTAARPQRRGHGAPARAAPARTGFSDGREAAITSERDPLNDILHVHDTAPDLLQLACYWVSEAQAQKHLVDVASFDRDRWRQRCHDAEARPQVDAAELEQLREENRRLLQRVTELEAANFYPLHAVAYDITTPTAGADVMRYVVTSSAWEGEGPEDAS